MHSAHYFVAIFDAKLNPSGQPVERVVHAVPDGVAQEAGVAGGGVLHPLLGTHHLALHQQGEVVGGDLVILHPLEQPPVIILHEPPVQHDLYLPTPSTGAPQWLG